MQLSVFVWQRGLKEHLQKSLKHTSHRNPSHSSVIACLDVSVFATALAEGHTVVKPVLLMHCWDVSLFSALSGRH